MRNLPETLHEYNIPRLNIWFIVFSLILLITTLWMVADDYFREWKPYQRQSKIFEVQKLREDAATAEKKMQEAGYTDVTNRLAHARASIEMQGAQKDAIQERLNRVMSDFSVTKIKYATEKALLDQRKSEFDESVELKKGAKAVHECEVALHHQEAVVAGLDVEVQALEDKRAEQMKALDQIRGDWEKADKERKKLETGKGLIEKRLKYVNSKLLPALLDEPLVEFAVPTVAVRQVIAEDQKYSLNFVDVPRIDRCITCHTFADKNDTVAGGGEGFRFANLPQPWKSHPRLDMFVDPNSPHPINRFGCSVCHLGWDRGTTFINSSHTPGFYQVKRDYVKLPLVEGVPYWLPSSEVEKWKPGLVAKVQEQAKLAEEKQKLKEAGAKGARWQEVRSSLQTARAELQNQYGMSVDDLSKFEFASMTQEQAWQEPKLSWHHMHHKEDPMRPREFIESSCLKCHQGVTDIPTKRDPERGSGLDPGEKLTAGLRLIEQAGCYACHKMQALETVVKHTVVTNESLQSISHTFVAQPETIMAANGLASAMDIRVGRELNVPVRVPYPKPGPSLLKVAGKTNKEWMQKWLSNPRGFRPNTFMPQFWNVDNNRNGTHFEGLLTGADGAPISIDWADRNAVEMASIAEYLFSISEKPEYPAPPAGNAERGDQLVKSVGCMGCHVVDKKLDEVAFRDRRYRSQGPMLFGSGSKYNPGWLYAWLKDPSQYRHDTRMPSLRLSDQEAADITAFLMANHNAEFDGLKVPELKPEVLKDTTVDVLKDSMPVSQAIEKAGRMSDQEKLLCLGDKMVQRYGCMNCHNVKGMETAKPISIELSDWASKSPTKLDFGFIEIPHENYTFLHQKLQAPRSFDRVETKRPLEYLRMPQYNFSEEQIELIMTAVMGMTGENPGDKSRRILTENEWYVENGRWLIKELNCLGCHVNEDRDGVKHGGAIRRTMDEDKTFLYPPSLAGVGTKTRPTWLHSFLKHPGDHVFRYWLEARMPTFQFTDDQLNTLTQYFALRDKQPYPYESDTTEAPPAPPKELVEAGEKIVVKLECLKCHAPRNAAQAAEDGSTAINFSMIKHRMRPKGIIAWLKNPQGITPDVNMPAFWPPGQPSQVKDILDGDSDRQIEAVAAYLSVYNASAPAAAPTAPSQPAKPAKEKPAKK